MNSRIIRFLAAVGIITIGYLVESIRNKANDVRVEFDNTMDRIFNDDSDNFEYNTYSDDVIYLTAKDIRQIRWMSVSQIRSIFGNRRGKIKVSNSEDAYRELRWMSNDQLKALFG